MNRQLAAIALLATAGLWQGAGSLPAQTTSSPANPGHSDAALPAVSAPSSDMIAPAPPGELTDANSTFLERESAGISLRIPSGCREVSASGNGDDIGQFADPIRKWEVKLQRITHKDAMSLTDAVDNDGKPVPGMLDKVARELRVNLGGVVVRRDVTNTADPGVGANKQENNVGMIAVRYTTGGARYLLQQAIVRSTERMFFSMTLMTPIGDGKLDADTATPLEITAVKTFGRMVDSVRLLDTAAIRREQDDRQLHTYFLLSQLHSPSRLRAAMVPKQWLRVLRDGRDVGYSYVTEQNADGPLKLDKSGHATQPGSGDGILIGVRARSMVTPDVKDASVADNPRKPLQMDVASWRFLSADQSQEEWSRVAVTTDLGPDGKPTKTLKQQQYTEFGSTAIGSRTQLNKKGLAGTAIDPQQPPVVKVQQRLLDVTSIDSTGASKPFTQMLPPEWYLPQALAAMLPRLLPLRPDANNTPRTYMFITYVPEFRQVMYRYVDVGAEGDFDFGGEKIHAIPISDRLGWHGSITTHYVSPGGEYLGSENKETRTVMRPTTADELLKIWKNADLSQPGAAERPKLGGAASAGRQNTQAANLQGPPSPIR